MKKIKLFGCPLHLGVSNDGIKAGIDVLNDRFNDLNITKTDVIYRDEKDSFELKNLNSITATCNKIYMVAADIIKDDIIPLFIGGDHSCSIGTVSAAASMHTGLGLLWVDCHSDINTDKTTMTGNIHGMPVSALMGFGASELISIGYDGAKIKPQNTVLFGVRDVDMLEQEIIERLNIKCYSYNEIKKRGLTPCLNEVLDYLGGLDKIHLSFDLDSLNPNIIKGISVTAPDGFSISDGINITTFAMNNFLLSSIDIVEYNPQNDTDRCTADFIYQLVNTITDFYKKEEI